LVLKFTPNDRYIRNDLAPKNINLKIISRSSIVGGMLLKHTYMVPNHSFKCIPQGDISNWKFETNTLAELTITH
jgi:hypothetical protein